MDGSSELRELTAAIADGDAEAFAQFYEARFDPMFAAARRFTGLDEADCLDIVQEAMVRMIKSMRPFQDEPALRAWMMRVLKSAAYDHLRARRRAARRERAAAHNERLDAAAGERLDVEERLGWLRSELGGLDRATAELIELRFRAGMTLAAIGRRAGMSPSAVDGRINRSIKRMRESAGGDRDE